MKMILIAAGALAVGIALGVLYDCHLLHHCAGAAVPR